MEHLQTDHKLKILLATLEQDYTSMLADSISEYDAEVSFFKFTSKEFHLSEISEAIENQSLKIDVVHLHWAHHYCYSGNKTKNFFVRRVKSIQISIENLIQIRKLKSLGCKIVWTVHNSLSHEAKIPISEYIFRWGLSRLCDDIIVMSNYSRQEVQTTYGRRKRIHVIPLGNFIGAIPNSISRDEARKKLDIPLDCKVLLNFGLMRPYKGIDDLLHAFKEIRRSDIVLLLAGNCSDTKLKNLIEESAEHDKRIMPHLKFIRNEDIQIFMNASDWGVFPFKKILNSASVLLALSMGKPVVVPSKGVLPEIVLNSKNGFLYEDKKYLGNAMLRALNITQSSWENMSAQAISSTRKYDWVDIGKQHFRVYSENI
ncbi:MAG: glycosyltransferase family 4 protein [Cyanobacteria bacterium P01_A01_bin.123]